MFITKAAIMFQNGEVVEGRNYSEANTVANKLGLTGDKIHGFSTSSGTFVLPNEAVEIAIGSNQIAERVDILTPETLWPYVGIDV